jgi:hypothetical protein
MFSVGREFWSSFTAFGPASAALHGSAGQSNTFNMSLTDGVSPPTPIAGTSYYNGTSIVLPPGNGVIPLLNGIKTNTGINCIALNGAIIAVPIASLMKGPGPDTMRQ